MVGQTQATSRAERVRTQALMEAVSVPVHLTLSGRTMVFGPLDSFLVREFTRRGTGVANQKPASGRRR